MDVGLRRDFTVSNWKFEGLSFHVFVWKKGELYDSKEEFL